MKSLLFTCVVLMTFTTLALGQSGIRRVDFKNFTYSAHCLGETPENITVKDGEFSQEKQEDGYVDRFYFQVFDIAFGDLDGDRREEAAVLAYCNTGGTGNFSEGFVYAMKADKPTLVARISGGDRAYGGLRTARIENGLLLVESNDAGPEGAACCPQIIVTTRYKLAPDRIVPFGKETRRDLYPSQRVTFAKGASGTTLTVTIPTREGKRFIVGARAGQTLTASVDTDQASLRLLGDVDPKYGANNFLAKLPKTGNYTVEVQNDAETTITVKVNIKIQ